MAEDAFIVTVSHSVHSCDSAILILAYWPRGDSAASSLFGGMPGGYGLGAHHLPSAYAILGRGGSAPGYGGHTPASAPPPPPYSHSSLGTLSVAASQAASLGKSISLFSPLYHPRSFVFSCLERRASARGLIDYRDYTRVVVVVVVGDDDNVGERPTSRRVLSEAHLSAREADLAIIRDR